MSDESVVQMKEVGQLAYLKTIARGEHYGIAVLPEFLNDWSKKWHVRRVIQVDPDLPLVRKRPLPVCLHHIWLKKEWEFGLFRCSNNWAQVVVIIGSESTYLQVVALAKQGCHVNTRMLEVETPPGN